MATSPRRWALLSLLATAAAVGLAGCSSDGHFTVLGYTTQPNYDPGLRTVYFPIPKNVSYRRGLEFELHRAVVRELESKTPIRVASCRERADTELELTVINRRKLVLLPNELNEVRDAEVSVLVEVVWRDLRPGHVGDILTNPKRYDPNELPLPGDLPCKAPAAIPVLLTPTANFQPELGGSVASAEKMAIDRAAVQIIAMMETTW